MDIRATGVVDDFSAYPPGPTHTTYEPELSAVGPPWFTQPAAHYTDVTDGGIGGGAFPPTSCLGFYRDLILGTTGACETWGRNVGDPALSDAWRMGLFTWDTCRGGYPSGYQALLSYGVSGIGWVLREYTNGNFVNIADNPDSDHAGYQLMRVRGTDVEVWFAAYDDINNWTLKMSAAGSHSGPFYMIYGTTGVETAWGLVGGGELNRQHIYRWLGRTAELKHPLTASQTPPLG